MLGQCFIRSASYLGRARQPWRRCGTSRKMRCESGFHFLTPEDDVRIGFAFFPSRKMFVRIGFPCCRSDDEVRIGFLNQTMSGGSDFLLKRLPGIYHSLFRGTRSVSACLASMMSGNPLTSSADEDKETLNGIPNTPAQCSDACVNPTMLRR